MNDNLIIEQTMSFVQNSLRGAEGGHDWWHIHRVWTNAKKIAKEEEVDTLVVELGALLHDIADAKFYDGNEDIGPKKAKEYLLATTLESDKISHIIKIIENISFKNSLGDIRFKSLELDVVQDADRLDAIGAIGIARAFNYGGFKNREIFNPGIFPKLNMTKEEYKSSNAPTINHFYEKLLLLTEKMNTITGKRLAQKRHEYMHKYLNQFYSEVGIKNWPC